MRRLHPRTLLPAAHGRRIGAGLALLAAVGVVVAIVLLTQSSTSPGAASAASQASGSTAVQRRNLVATDTESGTLSYAAPQTVYNRLSGTITWLPSVGQVIRPGQALFRVDGQPVILMNGSTPAYRNLNASDTAGPDILQLNRNLVALGFNPDGIVVDDTWQAATTAAVEVFQQSLGESPTGDLSLGQIVFLPGAQVVTTVQASLGSGGGSGTGSPSAAADRPASPAPEFVSLTTTTPTSTTPTTTTPGTSHKPKSTGHNPGHSAAGSGQSATSLQALIALLRAEIAELKKASHGGSPSSPHSGSPSSPHSGSPSSHGANPSSHGGNPSSNSGSPSGGAGGGGNATAVLQTASTELVATVALDASKQSEAKVGEKVTVEMPGGSTVNGTITAVSPVAQSSSNSGNGNSGNGNSGNGNSGNGNSGNGNSGNGNSGNGNSGNGSTIPVTIALSGHQSGAGLDQASVSVNFIQSEANNVLSVPVTALLATGGGRYAVQNAAAPHNLIPVTTGLFAAGYVQISGSGIYPGLQVTDSQG